MADLRCEDCSAVRDTGTIGPTCRGSGARMTEELDAKFGVSGSIAVGPGRGGLTCVKLYSASSLASAYVYLFGAHVTSWTDGLGRSRIFTSESALFNGQKAIRGGIPVCFPQFAKLGPLAQHGFARVSFWEIESTSLDDQGNPSATFLLTSSEKIKALWDYDFELRLKVTLYPGPIAGKLDCDLTAVCPAKPFEFTCALHAYFNVNSIKACRVRQMQGLTYRDNTDDLKEKVEESDEVAFEGEVDRVYLSTPDIVHLFMGEDSEFPDLTVEKKNMPEAVIWNVYADKSRGMGDLENTAWEHYVCIEPAVANNPVKLGTGESWTGSLRLR